MLVSEKRSAIFLEAFLRTTNVPRPCSLRTSPTRLSSSTTRTAVAREIPNRRIIATTLGNLSSKYFDSSISFRRSVTISLYLYALISRVCYIL